MDGYAVCKALKFVTETSALPLVILTARGEPNDRIKGLEIGADDYLTKLLDLTRAHFACPGPVEIALQRPR